MSDVTQTERLLAAVREAAEAVAVATSAVEAARRRRDLAIVAANDARVGHAAIAEAAGLSTAMVAATTSTNRRQTKNL